MNVSPQERRGCLRQVLGPLTYVKLDDGNGGIVVDLCEKGMRVQSVSPLAAGQPVELEFSLPGDLTPLRAGGTVAWSDGSGQGGIRFATPDALKGEINRWIFGSFLAPEVAYNAPLPALAQPSAESQLSLPAPPPPSPVPARKLHSQVRRARPGLRAGSRTQKLVVGDLLVVLSGLVLFVGTTFWWLQPAASARWSLISGAVAAAVACAGYYLLVARQREETPGRRLERYAAGLLARWRSGRRKPLSLF